MVYENRHLYLTIHWGYSSGIEEVGQVGIRFASAQAPNEAMVASCAPAVQTFWTSANSGIETGFRLNYLKLASIEPDGRYVAGSGSFEHTFPGISGGGGTTTARFPLQVAYVATFLTNKVRGRASKGRIYLPWYNNSLDGTYRVQFTDANKRSATLATMLSSLNALSGLGNASVMSRVGAGETHPITSVAHGTRPDTQRRRAEQLPDPLQTASPVTIV